MRRKLSNPWKTQSRSSTPAQILQAALAFWTSEVFLAAVEFGVFTKLGGRRITGLEPGAELGSMAPNAAVISLSNPDKEAVRIMKTLIRTILLTSLVATCVSGAFGDKPGRHPRYLHALSDLRHARAHLETLAANEQRDEMERHAIRKIDDAINEIKRAAIDDGKNINDHPPIDTRLMRGDRFRKALELLDAARRDVSMEEDDPQSQGLRGRVIAHIDEARRIVERLDEKYRR
jgi:hypothetical protein